MKRCAMKTALGLAAALSVTAARPGNGEGEDWPYRGLRVPVELYPDGAVRVQLTAGAARTLPDGSMEARDVRVLLLKPDGTTVDGWAETAACRLDQGSGLLTATGEVRMERGPLYVTGVGMEVRTKEQKLLLQSNVRVVLRGLSGREARIQR